MGVVWLAYDPHLDRDVAIKVPPESVSKDADCLKRFLREARLAAKLRHPNTVTVYELGTDDGRTYMVMELVEGGSLGQAISERPLEWREATRAVRDAALGLAAAHKLGLVHRDIKPENLMRTREGVTKVADFGLAQFAKAQTRYTQQGALMGTPLYMAPELWSGGDADARSDIYALVLTYYHLLFGRPAFDACDFAALGYQHKHEPLPDPRGPSARCRTAPAGFSCAARPRLWRAGMATGRSSPPSWMPCWPCRPVAHLWDALGKVGPRSGLPTFATAPWGSSRSDRGSRPAALSHLRESASAEAQRRGQGVALPGLQHDA